MVMISRTSVFGVLLSLGLAGTAFAEQSPDSRPRQTPRLAVVIVVDQMRPDYLDRFAAQYTGGLARLARAGVLFTSAYHDHAATETAVGHATISTGCYPSRHGIVGNSWYDQVQQKPVAAVGDTSCPIVGGSGKGGASPHNLLFPSVGDWLKAQSPASKVYSVALKDRAAILMGGEHPDGAFWYDRSTGDYVTSTYYFDTLPTMVGEFNKCRRVDSLRARGWRKLLSNTAYSLSHADSFAAENDGIHVSFPHLFDSLFKPRDYYAAFYGTPFADQLSLELATEIVRDAQLGRDTIPDLLWISCSAADAIGHVFGPHSHEIQDYYLRLDRYLDTFLTTLDSAVGQAQYVVVLTSDHGVMTMPEDLATQGIAGGRMALDTAVRWIRAAGDSAAAELHLTRNPIARCEYDIYLDNSEAMSKGIGDSLLQAEVAKHVRCLPFIADLFTARELASDSTPTRPLLDLFSHSYHPTRRPDIYLVYSEYMLVDNDPHGTTHGSPFDYDRHIPLIVVGSEFHARIDTNTVRSVDIAPTLARMLGVRIPDGIDGQPLF